MDKYDAANDHYCYPGTNILKNKLNIREMDKLERAERDITAITVRKIKFSHPPYDLNYMRTLHRQLFSDLYEWAGELRNVDISKGGTRFCHCRYIEAQSQKLFKKLSADNWLKKLSTHDVFCEKLAEYYCEFNMVHPFREGNGRVQRLLFEHLALAAAYDLDWKDVQPNEWIKANIDGVAINYEPMARIFKHIARSVE